MAEEQSTTSASAAPVATDVADTGKNEATSTDAPAPEITAPVTAEAANDEGKQFYTIV